MVNGFSIDVICWDSSMGGSLSIKNLFLEVVISWCRGI